MYKQQPVDLLMITWNRRPYVERTIERLLSDEADFRLYWWDNGSTDGAADVMDAVDDERVVQRHKCPTNAMQAIPTQWFLEQAESDVIGKIDDDTLVPPGWTHTISQAIREEDQLGMIGCWTFWMDDFERNRDAAQQHILTVGRHRILRSATIGGTAVLMRKSLAQKYQCDNTGGRSFSIHRMQMTLDGYISGWYYPLLWAEHMDDPRSEHCLMTKPEGMNGQAALTARARGLTAPSQYLQWIKEDADQALTLSLREQVRAWRWRHSLVNKVVHRTRRTLMRNGI